MHIHETNKASLGVTLAGGLLLGFGIACAPKPIATQPPNMRSETLEPNLCDLDGGQWCEPCGATHPCPDGSSGWLCCLNGVCVAIETTSECAGGTYGWCANYTESRQCNSVGYCTEVATCHDG